MPKRQVRSTLRQDVIRMDKAAKQAIRKEAQKQGKELLAMFQDIVSDWKHKPNFRLQVRIMPSRITLTVYATGQYKDIWKYVDEGTSPYIIRPKRGKVLRFRTGYIPRTTPIAEYGGAGRYTGGWMSAKQVRHPGIKARKFTVTIGKEFQPLLSKALGLSLRKAVRGVL